MVWTKITKIEASKYNDSLLVYFNFLGKKVYAVFSDTVKKYIDRTNLNLGQEIYVIKTFNFNDEEIYLIKNVR